MSVDIFGCHNWYMCVGTIGIYQVEAKGVAKYITITGHFSTIKNYLAQISIVLRLRNPDLEEYFPHVTFRHHPEVATCVPGSDQLINSFYMVKWLTAFGLAYM